MLFTERTSPYRNFNLNVKGGDIMTDQADSMKYLGVNIDRHLSFENHVNSIVKKVNQRTCMMWKVRAFIDQPPSLYLYKTLINPLFTYCDFIYDGCIDTLANRLQIAQNGALRAVRKCLSDYPTKRLHDELGVDHLTAERMKSTLKMVYRGIHDLDSKILNTMFDYYQPNRTLRSDSKKLLLPPRTKTKFAEIDIAHRGCVYWNPIPFILKDKPNLDQFKTHLKIYELSA